MGAEAYAYGIEGTSALAERAAGQLRLIAGGLGLPAAAGPRRRPAWYAEVPLAQSPQLTPGQELGVFLGAALMMAMVLGGWWLMRVL